MSELLKRFGVDPKVLQEGSKYTPKELKGRVLLYDGDGACYDHTYNTAKIETALNHFIEDIYMHMYLAQCDSARVHLTPRGCYKNGRHLLNTVKPYQGNRIGKQKPPLLEVLRSLAPQHFASHPEVEIISHFDIEADDGLMIDAYSIPNSVLISPDKDLNINPYESYNVGKGRFEMLPSGDTFGWLDREHWLTPSGKPASKVTGKGSKFFLAQMLMGDTADNVKGIITYNGKLCGSAMAYDILDPIKDPDEAVNLVIAGYREIKQNIIAEGEAMWLLRNREDNVYKFFSEFALDPLNLEFLEECYAAEWRRIEDNLL